MTQTANHHQRVKTQFGEQANAYLNSNVHAKGADLTHLSNRLSLWPEANLLDLGCGAGHVSFLSAQAVKQVTAYDLSQEMLDVVANTAKTRNLNNITTKQGVAEKLPFADQSFDIVTTRYSAHHWHDVGLGLHEIFRVLKPQGKLFFIDVVSPGHPVLDIWLQTVEALRDTSHIRDYTPGELFTYITQAGLTIETVSRHRLPLEFNSWVTRMRTPQTLVDAIRAYQLAADAETNRYFELQADGSFTSDMMVIEAVRTI